MVSVDILEAIYAGRGVQTPRTGDGGIDGILYRTDQIYLIQCKQYSNSVTISEIEAFDIDSKIWCEEHLTEAECIFVALNGYTQSAREKGEDLGITMLTGHDMAIYAMKHDRCIEKVEFPILNQKYWEEMSDVR